MLLKIGSVQHKWPRSELLALRTAPELAGKATFLTPLRTEGNVADLALAVEQTRDYIRQQEPDVLFLEWNLGNGSYQSPTFDSQFFLDYQGIEFVMITGTQLDEQAVAALNLPRNVNMQLAGQELPQFGPIVPDLVALADKLANRPLANPSDSDLPGDTPDASVRQKPGAQQPGSQAGDLVDEGVGDFASLATFGDDGGGGGGTVDPNPGPSTEQESADFDPLMEEGA
jgi:hypothetical protein